MNTKKPIEHSEARQVFERVIAVLLDLDEVANLDATVHPDFMGYGSAAHEFFRTREEMKKMARMQSEQLKTQQFKYVRRPISEKTFAGGQACLILEEFQLFFPDSGHELHLRLTTILEKSDGTWLVTHFHGSSPDSDIAEDEAFPMEGLRKKNEELEAKIRERTRELEVETALERVRSASMAMKRTDDISEVAVVFLDQLKDLGLNFLQAWINVFHPEEGYIDVWFSPLEGIYDEPAHWQLPMALFEDTSVKSWKAGNTFSYVSLKSKAEVDALVAACDAATDSTYFSHFQNILELEELEFLDANYKYGTVSKSDYEKATREEEQILHRFAKVFEQAYIRFLDLQKAEAQAREAEIEVALERVRSRSMAMQNSGDLKEVIRVIFDQLAALQINAEHAGIVVDYSPGMDWTFWVAETQDIPSKISVPYLDSVWDRQYTTAKEKGTDFFTTELGFEEKNTFYEELLKHIPGLTEETREFYLTCPGLAISTTVHKDIGLYIENFSGVPYSEEENTILRRFGTVFQQTYTRFLDLQKAEAQAREAEIDLALEHVRNRAMAMRTSGELSELVITVFQELSGLDMVLTRCLLWIFKPEDDSATAWMTNSEDPNVADSYTVPYHEHPAYHSFLRAWKSRDPKWEYELKGATKDRWDKILVYGYFASLPEAIKQAMKEPECVVLSGSFNKFGVIQTASLEPLSEENRDILLRFSQVFEQAYTRFHDLVTAEAQAREAQIEAALEKVRTRTMAMQKGEELKEVAVLLYKELIGLGVNNFVTCGYVEINEEINRQFTWVTSPGGDTLGLFYLPLTGDQTFDERYAAWKRQQTVFHQTVAGETRTNHLEYAITTFNSKEAEEMVRSQFPDPTVFYCFNFSHGYLHLVTGSLLKEEEEILLARFTRVFEQTYARFLDLKKAEAQAREAQIENALEKVRSRTMAMQHSDELPEAANVLFLEIQALGIPAWSCGYNILDTDKNSATCIMSSEGTLQSPFKLRLKGEASFNQWGQFVRSDENFLIQELGGNALVAHYDFMKSFPDLQPIFQEIANLGLELPTYQINHLCKFSHGFLLFITYEEVPEAHEIFRRFTTVFDQTYTRFLDLKRAEAQARESRIETALERVRARALAMQEPEELKEVVQVLRQEMGLLGVEELETSSIYINDQEAEKAECWFAIKDLRETEKGMLTDHFNLDLKQTWVGREMLKFYKSSNDQVSIVMKGEARKEWITYCEAHSKAFKGYYGEVIPERTYHLYKFSHGSIGAATPGDLSRESWKLLKRAASVFSLAYSRFKDLTQARLDLQRLKEEKKRAEDALKELQLTQQQLVHAEKMASLGELTAGIAHEIQNPLNFVNNFSEVSRELVEELLEEMKSGDTEEADAIARDVIQNLEKIVHHGKRADSIVKGMLQHSRSGDGKKEPTDLNALADEYLRLAYHGLRAKDKSFNAVMETDFDPDLQKVEVIPQDIGRVLLNLITNAFHAVSEKKASAPDGYEPTVRVSTRKTDKRVEISVRDNGGGIPEAIRDKIFQPFFTTKPTGEGTGLGLSMAYDIVTKGHGGSLEVNVEENTGSEFMIILPDKISE